MRVLGHSGMRWLFGMSLLFWCIAGVIACGEVEETVPLVEAGAAQWSVIYAEGAGDGIQDAASELVRAFSALTGVSFSEAKAVAKGTAIASLSGNNIILVGFGILNKEPIQESDLAELTSEESYLRWGRRMSGKRIFQIASKSVGGVQYGVYDLLRGMGVRYFHPSDTYTPKNALAEITMGSKFSSNPMMALRGFHHHTQHPIPMSVYLLEPEEKHLPRVQEYLRWLARNRQNVLQWHMLKTVDIDRWLPYMKTVKKMADSYGVKLGLTVSFADQQQNNFKLIEDIGASEDEQKKKIEQGLDRILEGGFQVIVLQFGTSEFTKVKDELALHWLNVAAKHLHSKSIEVFAWIHTEGHLKAGDGKSYYYHLPEKADPKLGAYLHTTMFYDLKNPAPVYGNENFQHQYDFFKRNDGKRPFVYFPETAWWLGFDNNMPLALPITGYSRALDILEMFKEKDLRGHVTFTTGMEWGYWKYDHYLTRVTWDRKTTWDEYLADFASTFGEVKDKVLTALKELTALQVKHLYKGDPRTIFYLAGELAQDEIGAQVGIVARSPKRPFQEILRLSKKDFEAWEKGDFQRLKDIEAASKKLFAPFPKALPGGASEMATKLFFELRSTLQIFVWRTQHTRLLYDAVRNMRKGNVDDKAEGRASGEDERKKAREVAAKQIEEAKAITAKVLKVIKEVESKVYRYPMEILATERKSLTSYPFGYLWETSTGFFWTRRDVQAEKLLRKTSGLIKEEWGEPTPALVFRIKADDLKLKKPENQTIRKVVGGFVPALMFAVANAKISDGKQDKAWRMATDHNNNQKPDADSVVPFDENVVETKAGKTRFLGKIRLYPLLIRDEADNELGTLGLQDVELELTLKREGESLKIPEDGTFRCKIVLENLIGIATQIAGLDRASLLQLLGTFLKFDPKNPPRTMELVIGLPTFELIP